MSPIELQRIINGAMASEFGPIEVNLRLTHDEIDNYSIAGQVRQPGVYPIKGEVTLVEALSTAGWVDDSADLQKIVLISKGPDSELTNGGGEMIGTASSADGGTSTVVLYDVDSALHRGYGLPDVLVRPEDIIMVPRTGAGDVMHWIDQHLPSSILLPLSNVYKVAGT
jgi:protein involved in polysaccharide export with SLBB domain